MPKILFMGSELSVVSYSYIFQEWGMDSLKKSLIYKSHSHSQFETSGNV